MCIAVRWRSSGFFFATIEMLSIDYVEIEMVMMYVRRLGSVGKLKGEWLGVGFIQMKPPHAIPVGVEMKPPELFPSSLNPISHQFFCGEAAEYLLTI